MKIEFFVYIVAITIYITYLIYVSYLYVSKKKSSTLTPSKTVYIYMNYEPAKRETKTGTLTESATSTESETVKEVTPVKKIKKNDTEPIKKKGKIDKNNAKPVKKNNKK